MDITAHRWPSPAHVDRNSAWHVDQAPVPFEVEGNSARIRPWVIWVVEAGTLAIRGLVIAPGTPRRADVLAALRAALLQRNPCGPISSLPGRICVDNGALYAVLAAVIGAAHMSVRIEQPRAHAPTIKMSTESIHANMSRSLLIRMSTGTATLPTGTSHRAEAALLSFDQFVHAVLAWRDSWNSGTAQEPLSGHTPLQAWADDGPEVVSVDPDAGPDKAWALFLADGPVRVIRNGGVTWRQDRYIASWMTGKLGTQVRIRYTPKDCRDIALYDAGTDAYLGSAVLSPGVAGGLP